MTGIYIATEDELSEAVADRLISEINQGLEIAVRMRKDGFGYLKRKLPELQRLARNIPVFMLTDLDLVGCAPSLIAEWTNATPLPSKFLFRVAIREVEAWLLADRDAFAEFSGAPLNQVPRTPEQLEDPKQELMNLIRRYGSRDLKSKVLPAAGAVSSVGLGNNTALVQYVNRRWNIERAAANADSLARTNRRLLELREMLA